VLATFPSPVLEALLVPVLETYLRRISPASYLVLFPLLVETFIKAGHRSAGGR